ncbi:helix-turn-helix domain-containing protein [Sporosarcina saromensis]|uniref:Helix-turn-helix domain-containing protein n=1 Tax=Sporosarcina saromensis TaxID=359365 RepID=A0ABU4GBK6_9BACL|nr:helix-turn-helix domain-containing protein [Sporosarcina saromensis]MDW0112972.1 helix-turn-helix domain-containing protein [Sporosarcina saromensis]
MKFSYLLRLERLRQNIKQEELAKGICSTSYLSKIENGKAEPSDEILQLLFDRLNFPFPNLQAEDHLEELNNQFKKIIDQRDRESAQLMLKEMDTISSVNNTSIDFLLIQTRLLMFEEQTSSIVENNLSLLKSVEKDLSSRQKFYYSLVQGLYEYNDNHFSNSLKFFNEAENLCLQFPVDDWEKSELHYVLSLASLSDYRNITAIEYAQYALDYFNSKMLLSRSISCLIIIGLAKKRIGQIEEAVITFREAMELLSDNDASIHLALIEHNLGLCYSLIGDKKKALQSFESALKMKKHANSKIVTAIAILKEYFKMDNSKMAGAWLAKCMSLITQVTQNRTYYEQHLSVYKLLLSDSADSHKFFKDILKYFDDLRNYYHCFIYCNLFSKKLTNQNEYKSATIYYEKAFDYYLKHKKVNYWGDL